MLEDREPDFESRPLEELEGFNTLPLHIQFRIRQHLVTLEKASKEQLLQYIKKMTVYYEYRHNTAINLFTHRDQEQTFGNEK